MELPHHDYIKLYSSGVLRLEQFDCIIVLSTDFRLLIERDKARAYHIPFNYIARCQGSIESLCCLLQHLNVPWLRFDTHAVRPEHICQCVLDFLRRETSSSLQQLLIAPSPGRAYLGGNFRTGVEWDHTLLRLLMERVAIRTALDVGCGNGESLRKFADLGISAWGLEGYADHLDIVGHRLFQVDFTKQWIQWPTKVDLVWCIEVLEHVPSIYEDNVIRTIARNTGSIAFVTAAPPGQRGYHHVNCQPQPYWIERFQDAGLRYVPDTPNLLSSLSEGGPFGMNVFKSNGMLFEVCP
jgi:SAM-dependent methyltransferase